VSEQEIVTSIADRLKASGDVKVVFGEPRVLEGKTIVPVASVVYGFGGGSGKGGGPQGEGTGSGGGGGLRVHPLGVLEITPESTRFVPVVNATRLATMGIMATVCIVWLLTRAFRKRK
jgi:uncharacterized spore protein YtfJ